MLASRQAPINYGEIRLKYPWLEKRCCDMVISTDFDGVISGAFLAWVLDWRLVGFYNSSRLWLAKGHPLHDLSTLVFVDADINRRKVMSIGHHVLKWSSDLAAGEHEGQDSCSFNPNLERGINKRESFAGKYPFATIHLLMAAHYAWGREVVPRTSEEYLPLLLHADSTLKNAINYPPNTMEWIEYLGGSDDSQSPLYPLCQILNRTSFRRLYASMYSLYGKISEIGYAWGSQTAIVDPGREDDWRKLQELVSLISKTTGWNAGFPGTRPHFSQTVGSRNSRTPTKHEYQYMHTQRPFSFAIISQGAGGLNYTLIEEA